jgi:uncharacterized protein
MRADGWTIRVLGVACLALLASAFVGSAAWPAAGRTKVIENFDLKNVTLEGNLRRQFDETRDFYLSIPNDDLLKPYRLRAGLPAPGATLGGHYVGHCPLPQMISGLVRMYAATGDVRCRDKAIALVDGWARCIAKDGFFYADPAPYIPPYPYDKWVGALTDVYVYAHYPKAKDYLAKITGWADKNLSRKRHYAEPLTPDGGEWYTLTENLLRAYMATGDKRYRDFAETWEYTDFWKLIAEGKDIFDNMPKPADYTPWYHAYSHINSFNGLATSYIVKGDRWYLDTLTKAWDFLMKDHIMVTGGYGQEERLVRPAQQAENLGKMHWSFETQCGSWGGFKVSEYLTTLTGQAKYGDWAELLVINGIGASNPMGPDGGVFYYSDYCTAGAVKTHNDCRWACCSGTRPQAITEYHDLIYYKDADGLYISLYTASSVKWSKGKVPVTVRQVTDFPESEKVDILIGSDAKVKFPLRLRYPNWLTAPMTATINGKSVAVKKDARGWAVFNRQWSSGDKLSVTLPMGFRVSRPDPSKAYPAALAYGPVTLAARYSKGNPARLIDMDKVAQTFEPVPGDRLNWRMKSNPDLLLRPFFRYKEGEPYFVYLDPKVDLPTYLSFTDRTGEKGEWQRYGDWITSRTPGAWVEFTVCGDTLRVKGYRFDDAGHMAVIVDGKQIDTVDEYGPNRNEAVSWDYKGLGPGEHKLRIVHLDRKSPESMGIAVNVAGVDCGF